LLDEHLECQELRFVRYGDDLLVLCDSKVQAQEVLNELVKRVAELKQTPSSKNAFVASRCWPRGVMLRRRPDSAPEAMEWLFEREKKRATDIYEPGEPFDFLGFEFDGKQVFIRQETLGKVKSRLEQYTQRSRRFIQKQIDKKDFTMGTLMHYERQEEGDALVSIRYARNAIQRINLLLGFKSEWGPGDSKQTRPRFYPGFGFAWGVLKCVDSEEIYKQFHFLDSYAFNRLTMLRSFLDLSQHGPHYDWRNFDVRKAGLMTFKDVVNRKRYGGCLLCRRAGVRLELPE